MAPVDAEYVDEAAPGPTVNELVGEDSVEVYGSLKGLAEGDAVEEAENVSLVEETSDKGRTPEADSLVDGEAGGEEYWASEDDSLREKLADAE
jgi:hypothetical protein